jgi:hypothetical protein
MWQLRQTSCITTSTPAQNGVFEMKPQPQATEEIQHQQKVKTAFEEWQDELVNKAEGTKNRYQNFFDEFLVYVKMNADELLKQRQQDALNPNMKIQRRIETQFLAFINKKKQEGYSISTQQIIFASIRSFFECHYFPLKMRRSDYPEGDSNGAKRATKEITLKLLDHEPSKNSLMYKAVIHSLNDSGLRIGDLRNYLETKKDKIDWWFKNFDYGKEYFAVKYWNTQEKAFRLFYPGTKIKA